MGNTKIHDLGKEILGSALDKSSGPPSYKPGWGTHNSWAFGAHYFFEAYNASSNQTEAYAAYGKMFPAKTGETLFTSFTAEQPKGIGPEPAAGPVWTLKMGVVGDPSRLSSLEVGLDEKRWSADMIPVCEAAVRTKESGKLKKSATAARAVKTALLLYGKGGSTIHGNRQGVANTDHLVG